jgi:hypothetical protein
MPLSLISAAFPQGGNVPKKYTCDGDSVSPPFAWANVPHGTRSFLFVCGDPDAPAEIIFHHWAAFDIPPHWAGAERGPWRREPDEWLSSSHQRFRQAGLLRSLPAARRQASSLSFSAKCVERALAARRFFCNLFGGYYVGGALCSGVCRTRRPLSAIDEATASQRMTAHRRTRSSRSGRRAQARIGANQTPVARPKAVKPPVIERFHVVINRQEIRIRHIRDR